MLKLQSLLRIKSKVQATIKPANEARKIVFVDFAMKPMTGRLESRRA